MVSSFLQSLIHIHTLEQGCEMSVTLSKWPVFPHSLKHITNTHTEIRLREKSTTLYLVASFPYSYTYTLITLTDIRL